MKKLLATGTIVLLVIAGCSGGTKQSDIKSNEFYTIDVTANYPKKGFYPSGLFRCGICSTGNQ